MKASGSRTLAVAVFGTLVGGGLAVTFSAGGGPAAVEAVGPSVQDHDPTTRSRAQDQLRQLRELQFAQLRAPLADAPPAAAATGPGTSRSLPAGMLASAPFHRDPLGPVASPTPGLMRQHLGQSGGQRGGRPAAPAIAARRASAGLGGAPATHRASVQRAGLFPPEAPPAAELVPQAPAAEIWRPGVESEGVPPYRLLRDVQEYRSERVYAEVLIPALGFGDDPGELGRIARVIAEVEGFDSMTVYRTLEGVEAHYSMEYADTHPEALAEGLLGSYERGRFKPFRED